MATKNGYILEANGNTISIVDSGSLRREETALNSNKLGGKAPEYYIQLRNLLDNSDFEIAQAGYGGKHGTNVYAADRWVQEDKTERSYSKITHNGHGALKCTTVTRIQQKLYLVEGEVYTASVILGNNRIIKTFTASKGSYGGGKLWVNYNSSGSYQFVLTDIPANTIISEPVLYHGSYTADTLPPYVPKGYGAELAECLRYFERKLFKTVTVNQNTMYMAVDYVEKRIAPSITGVITDSYNITDPVIGLWNIEKNIVNGIFGSITTPAAQAHCYGYLDISADL